MNGVEVPPIPMTTLEEVPTEIIRSVTKIADPATAGLIVPRVLVPEVTVVPQQFGGSWLTESTVPRAKVPSVLIVPELIVPWLIVPPRIVPVNRLEAPAAP